MVGGLGTTPLWSRATLAFNYKPQLCVTRLWFSPAIKHTVRVQGGLTRKAKRPERRFCLVQS